MFVSLINCAPFYGLNALLALACNGIVVLTMRWMVAVLCLCMCVCASAHIGYANKHKIASHSEFLYILLAAFVSMSIYSCQSRWIIRKWQLTRIHTQTDWFAIWSNAELHCFGETGRAHTRWPTGVLKVLKIYSNARQSHLYQQNVSVLVRLWTLSNKQKLRKQQYQMQEKWFAIGSLCTQRVNRKTFESTDSCQHNQMWVNQIAGVVHEHLSNNNGAKKKPATHITRIVPVLKHESVWNGFGRFRSTIERHRISLTLSTSIWLASCEQATLTHANNCMLQMHFHSFHLHRRSFW